MKIRGLGPGVGKSDSLKNKSVSKAGKTKSSSKGKASSGSDASIQPTHVEVGDHEQTLELIQGLVGESPEIRVEEVERVMNELKGGRYKVNFEKVAEGFLKEAIVHEMAKKMKGLKD